MPRSFFLIGLPPGGKLGDRAGRGRLGGLSTGIGVHLGVEHKYIDIFTGGQDVIESAVSDVVRPAVAADDPGRTLHQIVGILDECGDQIFLRFALVGFECGFICVADRTGGLAVLEIVQPGLCPRL